MQNEIYSLSELRVEDGVLRAALRYDAAHDVFRGHFPANPIVPGVCSLNMIGDLIRDHVNPSYRIQDAYNVKFLQLIRPADEPQLEISWKPADDGLAVNATIQLGGAVMMRFSGLFVRG